MKQLLIAVACAASALQAQNPPARQFELKAESPKFWELIDPDARLEKIAGGFGFTEGPVWDERGKFLYVSDESQNKLSRVFPDGRVETVLEIRDPDGSAFDKNGRLIVCLSQLRKVMALNPADGKYTIVAETFEGKKLNSPNDVVLGPDGALYFTDPNIDLPKGETQELPYQGVFRMAADGALKLLTKDLEAPNGLAFSPDGKRLYIDDTRRREIRVYDFTGGELQNGRLFAKTETPGGRGGPDGMKVDAGARLFVAAPPGAWVFDADGNHLGTIVMPEGAANLAWGDSDYSTLYFTARKSVYRLNTKTRGFIPR
jgi:gluconolactonase